METLVMVRTICCESHKTCGTRCVNCPNLRENRTVLESFRRQEHTLTAGRTPAGLSLAAANSPRPVSRIVLPRAS